mmetsp:Transcript_21443/g.31881  ORF Transcript_21443/g.31881 Transcript_21443/m.31881 type:complete len:379 (+) Transcript_21443:128-1264(+)
MNLEFPPSFTPPCEGFFDGFQEESPVRRCRRTEDDNGMEIDWKLKESFPMSDMKNRIGEGRKKRRSRGWDSDAQRIPKVRRFLSITDEPEEKLLAFLFVPMHRSSSPFTVRVSVSSNSSAFSILKCLSEKLQVPMNELVLRHVHGNEFKQVNMNQKVSWSNVIAYQVPFLRARVKKIEMFLRSGVKVKNFDLLNSMVYHRPFRILKMLDALNEPSESKNERSREWLGRALHLEAESNRDFTEPTCLLLNDLKNLIRESCRMEQYVILVLAIKDPSYPYKWNRISIPQYVPYILGETSYKKLRQSLVTFIRRGLRSETGISPILAANRLKLFLSGARNQNVGHLIPSNKLQRYPEHEDKRISAKLGTIVCDLTQNVTRR